MSFRIGHGFDLHRMEPDLPLIVGGLRLESDFGCAAHSDGDVVYHAVTDAILGALGEDDIGQLFPDKDPQWKAADSRVFVREAVKRMLVADYRVNNIDITLILQRPRISPHKRAIRAALADLLVCDIDQVNLKGKTNEHVDAIGESKAIACHAVVLLERVEAEEPEPRIEPPEDEEPEAEGEEP
ncbi:MAG: 2-C-methyl-D-erythritol 2,4-cyclodiphosphate synthase [Phycisphaeraceae bacterium]|nr:2-C-methyl-D-erythritol 2,4-cyclodiphosphate synthase [Phycisphaeraceae bacterium]